MMMSLLLQMLELKFEFIHWICGHEHYVALNLPIDIRIKGDVHASVLSDAFCRKHFMVGVLLKEVSFTSSQISLRFHDH